MFFGSIKKINRLKGTGMSNIYSKVTIEKNWRSQNFASLSLKNSSHAIKDINRNAFTLPLQKETKEVKIIPSQQQIQSTL